MDSKVSKSDIYNKESSDKIVLGANTIRSTDELSQNKKEEDKFEHLDEVFLNQSDILPQDLLNLSDTTSKIIEEISRDQKQSWVQNIFTTVFPAKSEVSDLPMEGLVDDYYFPNSSTSSLPYASLKLATIRMAGLLGARIRSSAHACDFLRCPGLAPLLACASHSLAPPSSLEALTAVFSTKDISHEKYRIAALSGLVKILSFNHSLATEILTSEIKQAFSILLSRPLKNSWTDSTQLKQIYVDAQKMVLDILLIIARRYESAKRGDKEISPLEILRRDLNIRNALLQIMKQTDENSSHSTISVSTLNTSFINATTSNSVTSSITSLFSFFSLSNSKSTMSNISSTPQNPPPLSSLSTSSKAQIVSWALGGVPFSSHKNKRGIRILSFDGGGAKGLLSLAALRSLLSLVKPREGGEKRNVFEMFDVICGTSTGGIIAGLLGLMGSRIEDAEELYLSLLHQVFTGKSRFNLIKSQASYDEKLLEGILDQFCKDELMIDSRRHKNCPNVFFVSTALNCKPPRPHLWRNYNYPPSHSHHTLAHSSVHSSSMQYSSVHRYSGSQLVPVARALRATSAAPTFFRPVLIDGALFCDGALVANNPAAIALNEAKLLYPGVNVELLVSVGTGLHSSSSPPSSSSSSLAGSSSVAFAGGWESLLGHVVACSLDTEEVHRMLLNRALAPDLCTYLRLNPALPSEVALDETRPDILAGLRRMGEQAVIGAMDHRNNDKNRSTNSNDGYDSYAEKEHQAQMIERTVSILEND